MLIHTASGNYFFLRSMGVNAGQDLPKSPEKTVTAKAEVLRWLKASFDPLMENYPKIDKHKSVKFLGHGATCDGRLKSTESSHVLCLGASSAHDSQPFRLDEPKGKDPFGRNHRL